MNTDPRHSSRHALHVRYLVLRAGIGELHLQAMLGHATPEMVGYYAQIVDDDLLREHAQQSPVERL